MIPSGSVSLRNDLIDYQFLFSESVCGFWILNRACWPVFILIVAFIIVDCLIADCLIGICILTFLILIVFIVNGLVTCLIVACLGFLE